MSSYAGGKKVEHLGETKCPTEKDDVFRRVLLFSDLEETRIVEISSPGPALWRDTLLRNGPTKSQLHVVRALVMPPFGTDLPSSQKRINKVGTSTNTPTNLNRSFSRSRASCAACHERRSSDLDEGSTLPETSPPSEESPAQLI